MSITDYKSIIPFAVAYEAVYEFMPELPVVGYVYDEADSGDVPVLIPLSAASFDYHRVLNAKFREWAEAAQKRIPFKYAPYADTGPLNDRKMAHMAGLGFYGRNCYLINEQFGALFFIGYLLTDLTPDLARELAASYGCEGRTLACPSGCDACVKACPTGALDGNTLDQARCISYLTQFKGELTPEQERLMSGHVYGCGICGSACVMNNGRKDRFIRLSANKILAISNSEFRQTFGKTASGWRGAKIIRRNAQIAVGQFNYKNKE